MREVVVEVVDVLKNAKKQKASPKGVNRSVRKRAKFAHYRTCTCPILYSLVSNPALPPESLGQIGFDVVGNGLLLRSEWAGLENADLGSE